MPYRPALHRPPGADASARARAQRERERQAVRPSAAARGYDAEWTAARAAHLASSPMCTVSGCHRRATDVDHIESIADAPHRRLDPTNFRSMCHEHHAQRTARDQGFARSGSLNAVNGPPRGARHPTWLGPSLVPMTVVCGPPGAGKSRWVNDHRAPKDLVLDLDDIAAKLSCQPRYHAPASFLDAALRWRNQHLKLCNVRRAWPAAWLIVSEPKAKWRTWWRETLQPYRVVVFETPAEQCIARIRSDEHRPPMVRKVHEDVVVQWWADYSRLPDDFIMRPGHRMVTGRAA